MDTTVVAVLDEDHPALAAQVQVNDIASSATIDTGVYVAELQPSTRVLADIRAVTGRILAYASRSDLTRVVPDDLLGLIGDSRVTDNLTGHSHAVRAGRSIPPIAAAVGVTAAMSVLGAPNVAQAGDRLRWLVTATRTKGLAVSATNVGWGQGITPVLTGVQLAALHPLLPASDQLRYRSGTTLPARPHSKADRAQRLTKRVPTLLWPKWSLRLVVPGSAQRQIRGAASVALFLVGTRVRLTEGIASVGSTLSARSITRFLQMLSSQSDWPATYSALIGMADYLIENDIPIDYARRRRLDYRRLLSDAQWREICSETGTRGSSASRARIARCFLFEQVSGLPASAGPSYLDEAAFRTQVADFGGYLTPELLAVLEACAAEFLAKQRVTDEPVRWEPPATVLQRLPLPGVDADSIDLDYLHHEFHQHGHLLGATAASLGVKLDVVRYLLAVHPAPRDGYVRAGKMAYSMHAAKAALPHELLIDMYERQGASLAEISTRTGFSRQVVARIARSYGITVRAPGRRARQTVDETWLYDQYVTHQRTLPELAEEAGMSTANMARWAKRYAVPLRPRGGTSHTAALSAPTDARTAPINLRPALQSPGGLERLRRFAAAAAYPTLTAAARDLGFSQSALVIQISRLERELDGPLFRRAERGRAMTVTPLGDEILAALDLYDNDPLR
ncbi:uncharacterized protein YerC [Nocardia transvalensis]|uniref:Uncharacterized protein YerC n=1 Tax=Nocardia transvalensis TaxID=37333 RepID=A0A7W9PD20_9NOCA|nr:LysR family transcriptional regulator [Nocardia transvalensis]MBB5913931.1 uncharacterized protein YerC [Nocardia transvalensis]